MADQPKSGITLVATFHACLIVGSRILLGGTVKNEPITVFCTEFLKNVVQMNFYGSLTQPQFSSDVLIRKAASDQKRNLTFPRGQHL